MEDLNWLSAALKWAKGARSRNGCVAICVLSGHNETFSPGLKKQAAVRAQVDLPLLTVSYQARDDLC